MFNTVFMFNFIASCFFLNFLITCLKCPYDQIFGSPHFYIFVKSMTFLLNFQISSPYEHGNWEVTFFDAFYTRLYGRHLIKHVPEVTSKTQS